ncbi:hypothetical protein E4U57_006936 [Claviceps arundinis]|uniref:BTB domain-containing protein n=1 Tax=Claviceps arundinis TaxID=1623583 RepID=A0ABQ7PJX8_9HYPO|nr:hypothetical protein E4U57_006936 [Claviceps arundinis]
MPSEDIRLKLAQTHKLRDANPLDQSDEFKAFILACRHGDLPKCQEYINRGVNINGRDSFDYTPLILASLCGHFELVRLLLDSGANAERNTFQGERCIYNALNNKIRRLLLQYDFSKTSDPHVYWSSHISSLLSRTTPWTSDFTLKAGSQSFPLHKFLLASRTPFFQQKLQENSGLASWTLEDSVPLEAVSFVLRHVYLDDSPTDLVTPSAGSISFGEHDGKEEGGGEKVEKVLKGMEELSKKLGLEQGWDGEAAKDRRLARQRFLDEEERALKQLREFFTSKILANKVVVDADQASNVKWMSDDNPVFADVLLRADEPDDTYNNDGIDTVESATSHDVPTPPNGQTTSINANTSSDTQSSKPARRCALYPVHKAMLIRSEYFSKMFSGDFLESQHAEHLHIITIDVSPPVLELVLTYLYIENPIIPLQHALDVLYAADMLFLDALKTKAAQAISALGNPTTITTTTTTTTTDTSPQHTPKSQQVVSPNDNPVEIEPINIYDVVHAAWDLRVRRLEEFAARYLAYHLEDYIDDPDFHDLIRESASRIKKREETDSIELLDDIRHYLSDRFRLRFPDTRLDQLMEVGDEEGGQGGEDATGTGRKDEEASVGGHGEGVAAERGRGLQSEEPDTVTEDAFASDAIHHQLLLDKIEDMLERLKLSA